MTQTEYKHLGKYQYGYHRRMLQRCTYFKSNGIDWTGRWKTQDYIHWMNFFKPFIAKNVV